MSEVVELESWWALPYPTLASAMEALKDAPLGSSVEEIGNAWLLLIPRNPKLDDD